MTLFLGQLILLRPEDFLLVLGSKGWSRFYLFLYFLRDSFGVKNNLLIYWGKV